MALPEENLPEAWLHLERFARGELGDHVDIKDNFERSVWYAIHNDSTATDARLPEHRSLCLPPTDGSRHCSAYAPSTTRSTATPPSLHVPPLLRLCDDALHTIAERLPPAAMVALARTCTRLRQTIGYDLGDMKLHPKSVHPLPWQMSVLQLMDGQCREATALLDRDRTEETCSVCFKEHPIRLYDPLLLRRGLYVCLAAQSILSVCPHWRLRFPDLRIIRNQLLARGEYFIQNECPCSAHGPAPFLMVPGGNLIAVREFKLVESFSIRREDVMASLRAQTVSHPMVCEHIAVDSKEVAGSLELILSSRGQAGRGECVSCSTRWVFFVEPSFDNANLLCVELHARRWLGKLGSPWIDDYLRYTEDYERLSELRDAVP